MVTNVNIDHNKRLLDSKIIEIYDRDYSKNKCFDSLNGILKAMTEDREFNRNMNLKLRDFVTEKYNDSEFHKQKLKTILDTEIYEYYQYYTKLDKEFLKYFQLNKGNKKKLFKKLRNNHNDYNNYGRNELMNYNNFNMKNTETKYDINNKKTI